VTDPLDPFDSQGIGPADPVGYRIEESPNGYRWVRLADEHVKDGFDTREDAVIDAEADRQARLP
jgi:hypothetical protein